MGSIVKHINIIVNFLIKNFFCIKRYMDLVIIIQNKLIYKSYYIQLKQFLDLVIWSFMK